MNGVLSVRAVVLVLIHAVSQRRLLSVLVTVSACLSICTCLYPFLPADPCSFVCLSGCHLPVMSVRTRKGASRFSSIVYPSSTVFHMLPDWLRACCNGTPGPSCARFLVRCSLSYRVSCQNYQQRLLKTGSRSPRSCQQHLRRACRLGGRRRWWWGGDSVYRRLERPRVYVGRGLSGERQRGGGH